MRTARPVGLSQDGKSLLVATSSGEELAIPVDDRLHAALRGDQPRLGQLEIEMENALGPRDIQSKIRSGQSLEEVGRIAGMPLDRVERWAAPVLAEREHVALLAMSSSVRKRGETSGHRLLRVAVTERLQKRGVDVDTVDWDSYRQDDGRWSVSASYRSGESSRTAEFVFDLQGRFSVAGNDEARWVLQEQSSVKGPQPGRRRPVTAEDESEPDTEPTLDLNDELALVRVIQPDGDDESSEEEEAWIETARSDGTWVEQEISPTTQAASEADDDQRGLATVRDLYAVPDQVRRGDRFGEQPSYEEIPPSEGGSESPLETLASMLRGREDPAPEHGGLSDASAVPETDNGGWEPGIVVDYPVEPSPEESDDSTDRDAEQATRSEAQEDTRVIETGPINAEEVSGEPTLARAAVLDQAAPEAAPAPVKRAARPRSRPHGTDIPAPPDPIVDGADRAEEAEALADQAAASTADPAPADPAPAEEPAAEADKPAAKTSKRKRAAVPSWDEIMFGGPSRPK
ncbi:MAG: septation protein SepH [Propionibacteriaceae bacterium]